MFPAQQRGSASVGKIPQVPCTRSGHSCAQPGRCSPPLWPESRAAGASRAPPPPCHAHLWGCCCVMSLRTSSGGCGFLLGLDVGRVCRQSLCSTLHTGSLQVLWAPSFPGPSRDSRDRHAEASRFHPTVCDPEQLTFSSPQVLGS